MELNDKGTTAKQIKSAEALAKSYDKAAASAAKISAASSGTAGSKKAAAAAAAGSAGMTGQDYGNARGTAGVTGASARDFANQSQGLGGLVRLYATYAANIFAVGAAFRALSTAMDTTNMVKGLDQLGAASGMALGSLSKRLVTATDGAISLREAMEATAKASSSGMNSQQILRMGEAAKKASQALGVDMGDAVSRLTRGITKLEPELLDELGIFVRVDDVVRNYAKSVGKSASALTDFERRQAYANAVLDQAERKFNAIKIDSNPYTKLSAALRDSLQSGLELINKVLTPLVSMLASSPSALVAVMVGISTVLLKQALPAIGQFRAVLSASAVDAANVAKKFKESFGDEFQARLEQRFRLPNLKAEVSKAESELAKLKFPGKMPKSLQLDETGALNQKNVNKLLETRNTLIATGMRGTKAASEAQVSAAKQEIAYIEKVIQLSEKRLALERASDQALGVASKKQNRFDPEIIAMKRAEALQLRADKAAAVSNASENSRILGIRGSWQLLNQEIADKGIKGISKYTTLASGGLAAVGTRVMGIVGSFGQIGMLIGIGIAAFSALHGWMTKAAEQAGKFDKSLENNNAAIKTLSDTIDVINSKPFGQQFTTASLMARSTAFLELANSISILAEDYDKLNQALSSSWWDRAINGIQRLWGGDIGSKMSESMSKSIMASINKLASGQEGDAIRKRLSTLLNIDPNFTQSSLQKALKAKESDVKLMQDVAKAELEIANKSAIASSKLKEFDEVLKVGTESYKKFSDKFKVSNEFTNLGESIVAMADKLPGVFDTPQAAVEKLLSLSKDAAALSLFDEKDRANIIKYSSELDNINKAISENSVALQKAKEKAAELDDEVASKTHKVSTYDGRIETQYEGGTALASRAEAARKDVEAISASLEASNARAAQVIAEFPGINLNTFEKGTELIKVGMIAAASKAGGALASAATSILGNLPGMAQVQADLQQQQLASENALIRAQMEMLKATHENTAATEITNALMKESNALATVKEVEAKGVTSAGDFSRYDRARSDLNSAGAEREVAVNKMKLLRTASEGTAKSIDAINDAYKSGDEIIRKSAAGLLGYVLQISGLRNQLNSNADKAAAIELKKYADTQAELLGVYKQELGTTRERISLSEKQLVIDVRTGSMSEAESIEQEKQNKLALAGIDAAEKIAELNTRELVANKALATLDAQGKKTKEARVALAAEMEKRSIAIKNLIATTAEIEQTAAIKQATYLQNRLAGEQKLAALRSGTGINNRETNNAVLQEEITLAEKLGYLRAEDLERLKARQQAESLSIELNKKLFQEAQAQAAKLSELDVGIATAGIDSEKGKALQAQKTLEIESYNVAIANENILHSAKLKTLEVTTALNVETAKFAEITDSLKSLDKVFEGLGGSLEGFGSKLADVAEAFRSMTKDQEKHSTRLAQLNDKLNDPNNDAKDRKAINKEILKAEEDRTKSELSNLGKVAGASKKLFSEKTAAHKALSAIERVSAAMSFALQAKQMAMDIAALPAKIAGGAATMFTQGGFAGFAGVAAMLAVMASLGASSSASMPSGVTAEDRQETQGTGTTWENGKKIETDFGALGDNNAKVADIANSIDYIEKYTLETSTFGYKSLKALNDIRDATRASAAEVAKSTSIFSAKSGFGTLEKSNPGFLGAFASSTNVIDKGIKVIADSLLDAASGKGSFDEYETIQKKKSGFFGIGASNKVSDNAKALSQQAQEGIQSMFSNAAAALQLAATSLGATAKDSIDAAMKTFKVNLEVSGKDMTGEEFAAALEAGMNVEMNKVVANAMPWLNQFRQLGEGFTGALLRVTTDFNVVVERLERLGVDFKAQIGNIPKISEGLNTALLNANTAVSNAITNLFTTAEETTRYFVSQGHWDQGGGETYGVKGTKTSAIGVNELAAAEAALAKVRKDLVTEFGSSIQGLVDAADSAQQALNKSIVAAIDAGATQEDLSSALAIAKGSTEEASSAIATSLVPAFQLLLNSQNALATVTTEQSVFNIAASERILKAFGGTEKAVALFDNFFDNFYSESEQKAAKTLQLNNRLKDIAEDSKGLISTQEVERLMAAGKNTRQEFKSLVLSLQTLSSGTGEVADAALNTYVALMGVAPALVDVTETIAQATMTMEEFYKSSAFSSFASDGFKYQVSLAAVNKEFVRLGLVLPKTSSELFELVNTLSMRGDFESVSAISALSTELQTIYKDSDSTSDAVKNLSTAFDNSKSSATAYYNVLKSTLSKYKDFARSLRELSDSLKLGDLSPLTPAQKYLEAKSAFEKASASAASGDQDALAKLQSASSAFLQASRTMYASSSIYTNDYNAVQSALDIAISAAEAAASENEMLIAALEETHSFLKSNTESLDALRLAYEAAQAALTTATPEFNDEIVRNFGNIDRNLDGLLTVSELKKSGLASEDAIKSVYKLLDVDGTGTISLLEALRGSSEDSVYGLGQVHSVLLGVEGGVLTVAQAIEYLNKLTQANIEAGRSLREADSAIISTLILGMQNKGTAAANTPLPLIPSPDTTGLGAAAAAAAAAAGIPFVPPYWYGSAGGWDPSGINLATNAPLNTQYQHWDSFAVGTNFVPNDMFAEIHKGERIIPAADNARLMHAIEGNGANNVNVALLAQIQELNKKVESLENTVREGAIVNAIATDRNTEEVAKAVKDTGSKAKFTETIKGRATVK